MTKHLVLSAYHYHCYWLNNYLNLQLVEYNAIIFLNVNDISMIGKTMT